MPTMAAQNTEPTAMVSVMRVPTITRDSISRPSSSVPSQCCAEGGSSMASRSCAVGSYGAMPGPNTATTQNPTSSVTPIGRNSPPLRARRETAAVPLTAASG